MQKLMLVALAAILIASTASSNELSAADLDKRRKALADLLKEQWEYTLRTNPEFASILGDRRYNDQSSDVPEAAVMRDLAATKKFLARIERIDTIGFPEQEAINKALMARNLREHIENVGLKEWEMPVTQISGIHLETAQLTALLPFATTKDYDDYAKRLRNFPKQIDDTIANMRRAMREKLIPPKFLLEKVANQAAGIAATEPEKSPFVQPVEKFADGIPEADRARLRTEVIDAVRTAVIPSYKKFAAFVKDEYAPRGRKDVGLWSLPEGAKRYTSRVRQSTTTSLSADEIHQIGLREVARIEGEMLAIAKGLGFNDLKSFRASLNTNPDLKAKSRQQILDLYRGYIDQMYAKLPQLFGRLPKAKLVVVPTEEFREAEAPGAEYEPGAPDGSRPGRVEVNTGGATERKTINMESTAYHEGVPGHHMQIAIAQELTGLPEFRRFAGNYTAYVEGWALYSEK